MLTGISIGELVTERNETWCMKYSESNDTWCMKYSEKNET